MKLNILERIVAIQTISEYKQGNFITFKTLEKLKGKLLVTEEEVKKYGLTITDDNYSWNELGNKEYVDFEFTEGETKLIVDQLHKLDKDNLLTANHVTLYDKFIPTIV